MSAKASPKTEWKDSKRSGVRVVLLLALFFISAAMQATIAPRMAFAGSDEFCAFNVSAADTQAPTQSPAHGWDAHCNECATAAAYIILVDRPSVARLERWATAPVYFDVWPFEPRERRRSGETRSRAPPRFS
ncbi:DUF2946 family protein [Methylocystis sp.]|uniref:DUF2946 family protein n=1 Tax=Methylocystis sp. TaxID=1911079 RepID=UPI003D138CF7